MKPNDDDDDDDDDGGPPFVVIVVVVVVDVLDVELRVVDSEVADSSTSAES